MRLPGELRITEAPWRGRLKVMWIWHAAVIAEYRKPLSVLGRCPGLDLVLLTPRRWPERAGQMVHAEKSPPGEGYRVIEARTLFTGFYYVYLFPSLLYHLLRERPDVIYCYEEPHSFISACVLLIRRLLLPRSIVLLYAAQNIKKRYPLPFRLFERYCFQRADAILACGVRVAETLRSKGYRGLLKVVALPTDTEAFSPDLQKRAGMRRELGVDDDALLIGYAGKLVEEKGLRTLWRAFAQLAAEGRDVHLALAGGGPLQEELRQAARSARLESRLHLLGVVHNDDLPRFLNGLDVFVLPSETRRNWREQFGRVLVEAMSCGVPVVGSDSGEIPIVLGDAGLLFAEGDSLALADQLRSLTDCTLHNHLHVRGRRRTLDLFSLERVAAQHYAIYEQLISKRGENQGDER